MATQPHRPLTLTTPYTTGPDVEALQRAVNQRRKARRLNTIAPDGEWGPLTDDAVRETAWVLGVAKKRIAGPISADVQLLIHDPERRNATQLARAKKRLEQLRHSADAVVAAALKHVGKTESPAGSNRGPGIISRCQKAMLGFDGFFWCGAFVGYFLEKTGGVPISRKDIVYTPAIVADAKAMRNGFSGWHPVANARPGDLALFDWNGHDGVPANHVELVIRNLGGGRLECVGGNTSKGGKDNNGGGVYRQERQAGLIGVARPRYATG
jgi:hypothetical protein